MMKHFFTLGYSNSSKNQLDEAIRTYLHSLDGTLILEGQKENFQQMLADKIAEFHTQHPRCKKIELDIWSFSGRRESLRCGCVNGTFLEVNHQY